MDKLKTDWRYCHIKRNFSHNVYKENHIWNRFLWTTDEISNQSIRIRIHVSGVCQQLLKHWSNTWKLAAPVQHLTEIGAILARLLFFFSFSSSPLCSNIVTSQMKFQSTITSDHVGGRQANNVSLNISIFQPDYFFFIFFFPSHGFPHCEQLKRKAIIVRESEYFSFFLNSQEKYCTK